MPRIKRYVSPSAETSAPKRVETTNPDPDSLVSDSLNATSTRPTADALKRLSALGVTLSIREEANATLPDLQTLHVQWREYIAQALVREPQFHQMMRNPHPIDHIWLGLRWQASLKLPFRYQRYNKFDTWKRTFFVAQSPNRQLILERAMEMHEDVFGVVEESVGMTIVDPPPADAAADEVRKAIFDHSTSRHEIVETIKSVTDLEYHLTKKITNQVLVSGKPQDMAMSEHVVGELRCLAALKTTLRNILSASRAVKKGRNAIDELLTGIPFHRAGGLWLSEVPSGGEQIITQAAAQTTNPVPTAPSTVPTLDLSFIARVDALFPFPGIEYYEGENRGRPDVLNIRTPRDDKVPIYVKVNNTPKNRLSWANADMIVAENIGLVTKQINKNRFRANVHRFESIIARPAKLVEATATSVVLIHPSAENRAAVVEDNLYHVRALIHIMFRKGLFVQPSDVSYRMRIHTLLRRMFALVALMYGCVSEGSLWLTTMDTLLEDLAKRVVGHVDPKSATITMRRLPLILACRAAVDRPSQMALNLPTTSATVQISELERENRALIYFAELARFYRGAVLMAYTSVSWSGGTWTNRQLWYESLINWNEECGLDNCIEALKIADNPRTSTQFRKFGLSVAVKDGRFGFPEARAEVSQSRAYAYPCFFELIYFKKWHAGHGPFFHYFAHLWHASCKSHRGFLPAVSDESESGKSTGNATSTNPRVVHIMVRVPPPSPVVPSSDPTLRDPSTMFDDASQNIASTLPGVTAASTGGVFLPPRPRVLREGGGGDGNLRDPISLHDENDESGPVVYEKSDDEMLSG